MTGLIVVLTIVAIVSGQPNVVQSEVESVEKCYELAAKFVNDPEFLKHEEVQQVAAGCAVVKRPGHGA